MALISVPRVAAALLFRVNVLHFYVICEQALAFLHARPRKALGSFCTHNKESIGTLREGAEILETYQCIDISMLFYGNEGMFSGLK